MSHLAVIGRYWPGTSPLHRMDPRAKLLMSLVVMVIVFCAQNFIGLLSCAFFIAIFFVIARISLAKALRSITPLLFILVITALLNIFFIQGGTVLFQWAFIQISEEGLYKAAFLCLRLFLLLLSMSLLTLTTTTLDITDAFESLLSPLARIGFPSHELSMILGLALRFLPQFMEEIQIIYRAQISRGAHYATSPLRGGVRMLSSLLVPLFTSAFRHAETLSQAMDARCYHGGVGRTKLHPLHYSKLDRNAIFVLVGMLTVVIATNFIPLG